MNLKQLFADEDAVSPVIGVILMVAITVILAAVIGTFVLGLGENVQDSAPQANFQFEYENTSSAGSDEAILITHTGGEDIELSTVSVIAGGTSVYNDSQINQGLTNPPVDDGDSWTSSISTGDTQQIQEDGTGDHFSPGDDVRVVWTSPSGGSSNTIGQSTVPN